MMRSNTADDNYHYPFSAPYPKPQFDYPTAHSRTNLSTLNSRDGGGVGGARSPSPTPSEIEEAKQPFIPRKLFTLQFYKKPKVILFCIISLLIGILTVLITIYHKQIEGWLRPAADWMRKFKFGFLIPIAILFVISFPPLFGHEIVAVLAGNVWGLWEGFGIVCAGTLLGEIGNFYAFKYLCTARGDKLERSSFFYGCLAKTVREGGFFVAVMARLSVIPGHFTTAVFATCGMNIFVFILAAILSLPKQFVTVYLGVLLEQSADGQTHSKNSKLISDLVVVISVLITSVAMWYILRKMKKHRLAVVRERRKRALVGAGGGGGMGMKPYGDDTEGRIPLTGHMGARGLGHGHGVGHGYEGSTSSLVSNDVFNPGISDAELAGHPMQVGYEGYEDGYDRRTYGDGGRGGPIGPVAPVPQRWDERGRAVEFDEQEQRLSKGYEDPYGYNSYPPPRTGGNGNGNGAGARSSPPVKFQGQGKGAAMEAAKQAATGMGYKPPTSPPPNFRPTVSPFGGAAVPPPSVGQPKQQQQQQQPMRAFSPPAGPPPGVRSTSPPQRGVHAPGTGLPPPSLSMPISSAGPMTGNSEPPNYSAGGIPPPAMTKHQVPAPVPAPIPAPAPAPIPASVPIRGPVPSTQPQPQPPQPQRYDSDSPAESPFEDKNAVRIPPHVRRYQLSDGGNDFRSTQAKDGGPGGAGGGGHMQEATDATFYSAHSRAGTDVSEGDLR